jgi:hypothetical protein
MADDYLDYNSADQAATDEEEKRRRREDPTLGEAAGQAWDKFTGKFTDSNGDFSMGKYMVGQLTNSGGANQQTPMEKQLMAGAGVPSQTGFMTGGGGGQPPAVPVQPQPQIPTALAAGAQPQPDTYASRVAQNESGAGGYDAIYGHGNAGGDPSIAAANGGRNLSQLSIGEALQLGDSRMANNAGALGKYQFLPSTLRGLMGAAGLSENDKFDAASQEKLFQAMTSANATSLERQGIQPSQANLAVAHAVGAGGAAKLLDPNNANLNAADVLGLSGAGRSTNPQLNKPVSEYLATMNSKFGGGQPTVAAVGREMGMGEPGYGGTETQPIETAIKQGDTATVLADAHASVEQLAGIVSNPNESKLAKQVALNRMNTLAQAPKKMAEANQVIAAAGTGDASATRDINNALKPPKNGKNEGSWLKALLLAKLGLGEAATREFALLGVGSTEHDINLDGKKGIVTMDAKGTVIKGYVEGKDGETQDMTADQIAKANEIAAKDKRSPSTATRIRDAQGTEWSQVPTTTGTIFYNNAGQRGTPQGKTVPISIGGDVELQNTLQLNKLRNQLQYVEPTKRMEFAANFDAANGTNFSGTLKQTMPEFFSGTTAAPVNVQGIRTPVQPQAQPSAVTTPVQPGGVPATQTAELPTADQSTVTTVQPKSPADILSDRARSKEKETAQLGLDTQQQKDFLEYNEKDITPKADAGATVARVRKQQINGPDGILNNPEIAGLLQGQGSASKEALNIVRDLITGNYKDGNDLSRRVASLDLSQRQKDVLNYQIGLQAPINAATLKLNAGVGAISEAEHKINRDANIDITRQGLYSGLTLMTRDQFDKDVSIARSQFRADNPQLKTTEAFNTAWRAESARLNKQYDDIYTARAKYISKYNGDGKNPGAVVEAFKYYPVPEFNSEKKNWDLSGYSASAARPPLTDFVK